MQAVVDNLLTSYYQVGDGKKTILFLHGWGDDGKTFKTLADQIIEDNKGYKAVVIDLPGFGSTQAPEQAWSLNDYSNFIKAFLEKTEIKPNAIIGHSNGGAIAINGLANNLFNTNKLILIGSAGIRDKSIRKTIMVIASKPAKVIISLAPKSTQNKIKQKFYGAIGSDYLVAEHLKETFKNIVSYDVRHDANKIDIPTCLIYGEKDSSTPPSYGEIFKKIIKNSQLRVLPDAGHFIHQEQVYKVSAICTSFIKEGRV